MQLHYVVHWIDIKILYFWYIISSVSSIRWVSNSGIELKSCDDLEDAENFLPTDSWRDALKSIVCKGMKNVGGPILNIIVAHRETIRKLAQKKIPTPYCSVALFQPSFVVNNNSQLTSTKVKVPKLPPVACAIKPDSQTSLPSSYAHAEDILVDLQYTLISKPGDEKSVSDWKKKRCG
jgi:hypothetical protein